MGLLSRLKDISTGKLISFLEKTEQPELMIPQLLSELQKQQVALHNAEAKSLAAVRAAQRRLEETMGRALRLKRGAELAMKKGEEETAREALHEQIKTEKSLPSQRRQIEQAQKILDDVRECSGALKDQVAVLKEQKVRLKTSQIPTTPPVLEKSVLNKVAQMEEHVVTQEIELEVSHEIKQRKRSLDERLLELEQNEEIEKRLHTIRKEQNYDG